MKPNPKFIKSVPAKHRKKWHDALVNTKHQQGGGCLVDSDGGYCCLGIGHEAFGGAKKYLKPGCTEFPPPQGKFSRIFGQGNDLVIGIGDSHGLWTAAECNDEADMTFKQIAKLVYPEAYQ